MITAMTLFLIIALATAAVVALMRVVWWALVDNDGYGRPDRAATAPRSHFADFFEPPHRLA